jgi:hypothetical protein
MLSWTWVLWGVSLLIFGKNIIPASEDSPICFSDISWIYTMYDSVALANVKSSVASDWIVECFFIKRIQVRLRFLFAVNTVCHWYLPRFSEEELNDKKVVVGRFRCIELNYDNWEYISSPWVPLFAL